MKRELGLDQISKDPASVVTVGTFDGVHLGHQAVLRYLVDRARDQAGRSVVLSFDPHPRQVVHGEDVPLLTTIEERADAMEKLGIDRFIVIPFTAEFSNLHAEEFVRKILVERIGLREIVIGYDHAFGRDRRGGADLLTVLGREHGFTVDVIPPQVVRQHVVSSSELREIISSRGDVALAAQLLGRPYSFLGTVVKGEGRGRGIGFPTANLRPNNSKKVVPAVGVYAVRARRGDATHDGMMNIGHRPTFGDGELALEVHLLDFDGDLYGTDLRVEFVARMRDERKFESLEALTQQLSKDRARCMDLLGG
jgi:riboflavin kinase/FMN adenylyltransferase